LTLVLTSLLGGTVGYPLLKKHGEEDPRVQEGRDSARGGVEHRISRPDGTVLRAVSYGPEEAPTIVMTHGWGLNSAIWHYAKTHLAGRYRLILWDLPGLGKSGSPANGDWSLEKMAGDLHAVLELAGPRPVILLGHSIGGMITLTFCRLFPETLGERVAGLVLAHTTYTNPVKTTSNAGFYTAIQKPVLEPLCYLMIWLAPLVWLMNWMSYLNGSMHRSTDRDSFSGNETWEQLDFAARLGVQAWPNVVARGMLAMLRYDATDVLGRIGVPTLVVAGDQDPTTRPEASAVMAQSIPTATLVTLQPAKHLGHFEHHAQFAEAVARLVATCAAKARPVG
jgi:pimeloyl-ACP methyl ester carboxylesterase